MTVVGILIGIVLLSAIMIIHELGHYLVGLALGFKIEQFSLFMGPVLFERVAKNGVRFNIKAFPIGASVSFVGEAERLEGQDATCQAAYTPSDPGLFANRPRWARALVLVAGPAINIVSAMLVFVLLFACVGTSVPIQGPVAPGSVVAEAGVQPGDRLLAINGQSVQTPIDLSMISLTARDDSPTTVRYIAQRDGQRHEVKVAPAVVERRPMLGVRPVMDDDGGTVAVVDPRSNNGHPVLRVGDRITAVAGVPFTDLKGVQQALVRAGDAPVEVQIVRGDRQETVTMRPVMMNVYRPLGVVLTRATGVGAVLSQSVQTPWSIVKSSFHSLVLMISGRLSARDNLMGPIGIVNMVGNVVKDNHIDWSARLSEVAMLFCLISVAVGFINLLPIPPFDGNHLLLLGVEGVIRRDLPQRFKNAVALVGFLLILVLAVYVVYLDISRLVA